MANFLVELKDGAVDCIADADTYQQEGPLTTFFRLAADHRVIDCWSVRLLSVRTADIASIRRVEADVTPVAAAADRRACSRAVEAA